MKTSYSNTDSKNIIVSPDKTVLLADSVKISGVTSFSYAKNNKARLPMIEHSHKDKFEFVIIAEGLQQYFIENDSFMLYPCQAVCTAPNEVHSCGESFKDDTSVIWFQIDAKLDSPLFSLSEQEAFELKSRLFGCTHKKLILDRQTLNGFLDSFKLLSTGNTLQIIEGRSLFISSFCRALQSPFETVQACAEIERAKKYIFIHVKEKVSLSELLEASGLDINTFKDKFTAQVGQDYKEYILSIKLQSAKNELIKGVSLDKLAFEYGFASVGSFNKAFKRQFGESPKKFCSKNRDRDIL